MNKKALIKKDISNKSAALKLLHTQEKQAYEEFITVDQLYLTRLDELFDTSIIKQHLLTVFEKIA